MSIHHSEQINKTLFAAFVCPFNGSQNSFLLQRFTNHLKISAIGSYVQASQLHPTITTLGCVHTVDGSWRNLLKSSYLIS